MLPDFDILRESTHHGDVLVVLPVYNEISALPGTLKAIGCCCPFDILAIDDCSQDGSADLLLKNQGISVLRNRVNAGAGGVLLQGFKFALERGYQVVVTMDSDGQHNACQVRGFVSELEHSSCDMVWGTRYPAGFTRLAEPFQGRQLINREITERLTAITGWTLTDSFCGFRAYRSEVLSNLVIRDNGYGMLLEMALRFWHSGRTVQEFPVPLIYLDKTRDFQHLFQSEANRLAYYHSVIDSTLVDLGLPSSR